MRHASAVGHSPWAVFLGNDWATIERLGSVQFYLPLLLDAARRGRLTLERVVELTSTAPARVFALSQKGRLEVGADADLAIVDLEREYEIRDEDVLSKIGWTPYAGRLVRGAIEATIVRGRVVFEHGRVVGEPGWGRQATPHQSGDAPVRSESPRPTALVARDRGEA